MIASDRDGRPPRWAQLCCRPGCCGWRAWPHNWTRQPWKIPWGTIRDPVNWIMSLAIFRAFVAVIIFKFLFFERLSTGWMVLDIVSYAIYITLSTAFQLSACYGIYQESPKFLLIGIAMEVIVLLLSILFSIAAIFAITAGIMTFSNISQVVALISICFADLCVLYTMMKIYSSLCLLQRPQIPL